MSTITLNSWVFRSATFTYLSPLAQLLFIRLWLLVVEQDENWITDSQIRASALDFGRSAYRTCEEIKCLVLCKYRGGWTMPVEWVDIHPPEDAEDSQ